MSKYIMIFGFLQIKIEEQSYKVDNITSVKLLI